MWPAIIAAVAGALQAAEGSKQAKQERRFKAIESAKERQDQAERMKIETARRYGDGQQSSLNSLINALQRAAQR